MTQNKTRGKKFIQTDEMIKNAYIEYIKLHSTMPTQQEIADKCGIGRKTVWLHLHDLNIDDIVEPFKIFGPAVLMGLVNRAKKGDARAVDLYMKLAYKFTEKHEIKADIEATVKHEHKREETVKKYAKIFDKITEE